MSLTEIGGGGECFRAVGRREHAVEMEASWGITKLRMDRGHAIDVGEALAVVLAATGKEAERAHVLCVTSCFSM